MPSTTSPRWVVITLALGVAACSGSDEGTNAARSDAHSGAAAAQRAYLDPDTGSLTTPPQTKAGGAAKAQPKGQRPAYTRENRRDGSVSMRPKDPTRHVIEGRVDGDGVLRTEERDQHAR